MKTIGERIRQARVALKMSGYDLAKKVGYKNQSAIGNLENRVTGNGGNKIGAIADALRVPVEWLLRGPDLDNVPFLPGMQAGAAPLTTTIREEYNHPRNWPFKDVSVAQYALLQEEEKEHIEKDILLRVKNRGDPVKHTLPAKILYSA